MKDTKIDQFKVLKDEYHANDIQLVIRCFENNTLLLNGAIFYSNILSGGNLISVNYLSYVSLYLFLVPKKKSGQCDLNISIRYPSKNKISFDYSNLYQIACSTKVCIKIN
jgi:hypothetical protein